MTTTNRNAEWHALLSVFAAESLEQMDVVETQLLKLEGVDSGDPAVRNQISGIFRLFHSLKGGAASLELNVLRDATHQAENLLQLFRDASLTVTSEHVDLMCRTCDLARKGLELAVATGQDEGLADDAGTLIVALNCEFSRLRGDPVPAPRPETKPVQHHGNTNATPPAPAAGQQAIVKTLFLDTLAPPPDLLSNYGTDQFPAHIDDLNIALTPGMRAGFAREGAALLEGALTALRDDRDTPRVGPIVVGALRHLAAHAGFFGFTRLRELLDDSVMPYVQIASKRRRIWPESYCTATSAILLGLTGFLAGVATTDDEPSTLTPQLDREIVGLTALVTPGTAIGVLHTDPFPGDILDDCREETTLLLAEIHAGVEELGAGVSNRNVVAGMARAFHSIKGATGLLIAAATRELDDDHPLRILMRTVHEIEDRLIGMQAPGKLPVDGPGTPAAAARPLSPAEFDFISEAHAATRLLLDTFFAGEPVPIVLPPRIAELVAPETPTPAEALRNDPIPGRSEFAASIEDLQLPRSSVISREFATEGLRLCERAERALKDAREREDDAGALLQMFKAFHGLAGLARFFGFHDIQNVCNITEALVHCLLSGVAFSHTARLYAAIESSIETLRSDCGALDGVPASKPASLPVSSAQPGDGKPAGLADVAGRMQKILDEVNTRQTQAELFAPGTKPEDIFEKQMLRDFREDGEQVLQHVEELVAGIHPDTEARAALAAAMRVFHSIKSNAALMISGAQTPLPPRHPLQFVRAIAHGAEALLAAARDNPLALIDAPSLHVLTRCIEVFRSLRQDFFRGEASVEVPLDLLQNLGLSIGQFRQTDLTLLNECMSSFASHPESVDRAEVLAFLEALKNLTEVCTRLGRSDLFTSIRAQQQLLDVWLAQAPQESFAPTLAKLTGHHQELIKLIQKPATAHARQVAAAEKVRTARDEQPADAAGKVTLRVDEEKVDRLLRLVGELVMARNPFAETATTLAQQGLPQLAHDIRRADLEVARLANDLQRTVNSIRMLPVRSVFQRFPRLVRVLAKDLGKELRLDMHGEATEVDKTVVELLADPLVHLVRNAVDHGIETPEERRKNGKKPEGSVQLSAVTEGNVVTISVADDGKGLDPERLKAKAVEKGLIDSDTAAKMSVRDAYNLVFLAGFSTAEKLTDVSGRGVGMDVVATNIRRLHGTVDITSKMGQGSVFSLKIPANYIQAILVQSQGAEYLIPVDAVSCLIKVPEVQIHAYRANQVLAVRGRIYPFMDLGEVLGKSRTDGGGATPTADDELVPVAVLESSTGSMAVGVDRFLGEMQVMIKPLTAELGENRLFAGASIMGDGRIVLVLNPQELSQHAAARLLSVS